MRAAVILAAIAIKLYLWLRIVPHRLIGYGLLVLAVLIAFGMFAVSLKLDKKRNSGSGPFCASAPYDYDGFQSCEYKLREAKIPQQFMRRHVGKTNLF